MEGEEIHALIACLNGQRKRFDREETVLAAGSPVRRMGIVLAGCVQVERMDFYGNRSIMAKLQKGQLFAEAFACAGTPVLPLSVTAAEESEILFLDAQRVVHSCGNACSFHTKLIYNLMRILAVKNLVCQEKIEITSQRTTREKLMAYLTLYAAKAGSRCFTIPFDRQELADYLEVDRSGLSAEIGKLSKEGVLRCHRSRFELLEI